MDASKFKVIGHNSWPQDTDCSFLAADAVD